MWPLCGLNRANVENILVYLQNQKLHKIELNITSKSLIYSGLDLLCEQKTHQMLSDLTVLGNHGTKKIM